MKDFFIFHHHLRTQGQQGRVVRPRRHLAVQQHQFKGVNLTLQPHPYEVGRQASTGGVLPPPHLDLVQSALNG